MRCALGPSFALQFLINYSQHVSSILDNKSWCMSQVAMRNRQYLPLQVVAIGKQRGMKAFLPDFCWETGRICIKVAEIWMFWVSFHCVVSHLVLQTSTGISKRTVLFANLTTIFNL